MSFNGKEGAKIDLATAKDLTANHRSNNSGWPNGLFIGRDALEDLLKGTDAQGIRFYYGEDASGANKTLIAVAANSGEDDITSTIYDNAIPCPTRCGKANDLNS